MSGGVVRVIVNLLLADVISNAFFPAVYHLTKNSIFRGNANSTVSPMR